MGRQHQFRGVLIGVDGDLAADGQRHGPDNSDCGNRAIVLLPDPELSRNTIIMRMIVGSRNATQRCAVSRGASRPAGRYRRRSNVATVPFDAAKTPAV